MRLKFGSLSGAGVWIPAQIAALQDEAKHNFPATKSKHKAARKVKVANELAKLQADKLELDNAELAAILAQQRYEQLARFGVNDHVSLAVGVASPLSFVSQKLKPVEPVGSVISYVPAGAVLVVYWNLLSSTPAAPSPGPIQILQKRLLTRALRLW